MKLKTIFHNFWTIIACERDFLCSEGGGGGGPVFVVHVSLVIPLVAVRPTLDEVQEALTNAGKNITSVARGVGQWTGGRMQQVRVVLGMLISAFSLSFPSTDISLF
jgi:hypothetical protein